MCAAPCVNGGTQDPVDCSCACVGGFTGATCDQCTGNVDVCAQSYQVWPELRTRVSDGGCGTCDDVIKYSKVACIVV